MKLVSPVGLSLVGTIAALGIIGLAIAIRFWFSRANARFIHDPKQLANHIVAIVADHSTSQPAGFRPGDKDNCACAYWNLWFGNTSGQPPGRLILRVENLCGHWIIAAYIATDRIGQRAIQQWLVSDTQRPTKARRALVNTASHLVSALLDANVQKRWRDPYQLCYGAQHERVHLLAATKPPA